MRKSSDHRSSGRCALEGFEQCVRPIGLHHEIAVEERDDVGGGESKTAIPPVRRS
jgi:hypothetical protein